MLGILLLRPGIQRQRPVIQRQDILMENTKKFIYKGISLVLVQILVLVYIIISVLQPMIYLMHVYLLGIQPQFHEILANQCQQQWKTLSPFSHMMSDIILTSAYKYAGVTANDTCDQESS